MRTIVSVFASVLVIAGMCGPELAYGVSGSQSIAGEQSNAHFGLVDSSELDTTAEAAAKSSIVGNGANNPSSGMEADPDSKTGFIEDGGETYYYGDDGAMRYGEQLIGGR